MQRQLKQTVAELLRVYLRGKHPLKTDAQVSELLLKRTQGGALLEEEWADIVRYMYAPDDATLLVVRIKELARAARSKGVGGNLLSSRAHTAHKPVWLSNMTCIYGNMRHWSDRWLDSAVFFSSFSSSSSLERESS